MSEKTIVIGTVYAALPENPYLPLPIDYNHLSVVASTNGGQEQTIFEGSWNSNVVPASIDAYLNSAIVGGEKAYFEESKFVKLKFISGVGASATSISYDILSGVSHGESYLDATVSAGINYAIGYGVTTGVEIVAGVAITAFTGATAPAWIPVVAGAVIGGAAITYFNAQLAQDTHNKDFNFGDAILNALKSIPDIISPHVSQSQISQNEIKQALLSTIQTHIGNDDPIREMLYGPWLAALGGTPTNIDPLILDLDGNGVQTTALTNSGTYFDMDANGYAEHTAWVSAGDGILFQDLNHDGLVTNGTELFGPQLLTNGQTNLGVNGTDGFTALAALDSNHDGKIDASDPGFANLMVLKGDGTTYTLAQLGITSLNLTNTTNFNLDSNGALPAHTHEQLASWTDANGNLVQATGSYTKADGSTAVMDSYLLNRDPINSVEPTQVANVSDSIAALPYVNKGVERLNS